MSDLIVTDEGEFWESENRETLIEKKDFLQSKINDLAGALESIEVDSQIDSIDEIVAHIERIARKVD